MSRLFEPRPYQKMGMELICRKPAVALMMDMGMGKTATTLAAIEELMYDRFEVEKALVIAPLRVALTTWPDECAEWDQLSGLRVVTVTGSLKERLSALAADADIYTINRENVVWLVEHYGREWPFDMVVIDESSSFKNSQSKRFKALRRIRPRIKRLVELTGTPAPNGLIDLWSQVYLLDSGERLGKTIGEYRRRWFRPGAGCGHVVYDWVPVKGADKEIYGKISDICVSLKSEDYISLPPVIYNTVKVFLPEKAMAAYRKMERDLVLEIKDTEIVASTAAALSGKLLQMANGCAYSTNKEMAEVHSAKLEALEEIVESNNQRPLLVFYWFRHDLARIRKRFPDAVSLEGADTIRAWNEGRIRMLLAHPASAGHGLNLQHGGSTVVWFSLTWSLELYQQANKRLHRPGQRSTVFLHHIVAKGTIDEAVMGALKAKKTGQDGLLEAIRAKIKAYRKEN